jgi:hypothetical protein
MPMCMILTLRILTASILSLAVAVIAIQLAIKCLG